MDAVSHFDVGAELLRSRARLNRARPLAGGVWLAHWSNGNTQASYVKPGHHTLSFYLDGGHEVRCREAPSARGEPGSLCLLPAGHESRWDVNGSLQLLHLYLPGLQLAQAAERWFDADPRFAALSERIFFHDEVLAGLCRQIARADWDEPDAALVLAQLAMDAQARLIASHTRMERAEGGVRGGLSAAARRRVLECIEQRLHESPGLSELADAACLSEYHFARMFKASFGQSPHAWVMQRRIERARRLLGEGRLGVEDVAQRCGYAHLSHMNAALKRAGLGTAARLAGFSRKRWAAPDFP